MTHSDFPSPTSLAACAIGAVGSLTLGASEAAVVYVNYGNTIIADLTANDGAARIVGFDLNNDGAVDFRLATRIETGNNLAAVLAPAGGVLDVIGATAAGFFYPDRLAANKGVDASAAFITLGVGSLAVNAGYANSKWIAAPNNTGYLGFKFQINGGPHYGWMRLTVAANTAGQPRAITLHEAGYEAVEGATILTGAVPEPGGLGLLALGSLGVALHRRRTASTNMENPKP